MYFKVLCLFFYVFFIDAAYEGEQCVKDGTAGVCTNLNRCQTAMQDLKNRKNPQTCSFNKTDPIVCCLDGRPTGNRPVATTTKRPAVTTTTKYLPPTDVYEGVQKGQCAPILPAITSPKTGQKAFDKCIEYQDKYVYPCEKGTALTGELSRSNRCHHSADELIIGGTDAAQYEFPHMVLLGFDNSIDITYQCAGSIISEQFVLTAGHCTGNRFLGPVKHIVIGAILRSDVDMQSNVYKVKKIIRHPQYKPPAVYNDIGLIETDKPMALNQFIVPACLHTGDLVNDSKAVATGWGLIHGIKDSLNDSLKKVVLDKFSAGECKHYIEKYSSMHHITHGFENSTQTCYGDRGAPQLIDGQLESKDTCRSDGGFPIQIKSKNIHCMYTVVGVTAAGRYCGFADTPGLYTRVAPYVPWIESIVWPN